MKHNDMIRKVFQVFTIILFIIQFEQSLKKYFQFPVVEQTSRVPVKDFPLPVIYVCQANQFNYTKARENGYRYFTHFMLGILMNSTNISWQGKAGHQTFTDLKDLLFDSDYSSLTAESISRSENNRIADGGKRTFLFPHGICMKLENLQQHETIKIKTTKDINIYLVDPAKANDIRTEVTLDAKTSIGPTSDTFFSFGNYELEYLLYDHSINDGITCTDYTKSDISYGECLNNSLKQESMATYGCLLPWISTNNKSEIICGETTNIDANAMRNSPLYIEILYLIKNFEPKAFKRCLPPCKTMQIKLNEVNYKSKYLEYAGFEAICSK